MVFRIAWGLLFMITACALQAQTRKIGHRSHSGAPETFAMMMGDEHLGEYIREPTAIYNVDPFVVRVRKYYEEIAKKAPEAKAGVPEPVLPKNGAAPIDSVRDEPSKSMVPSAQPQPKSKKHQRGTASMASEVPSPDFLVQTHSKSPTATAQEQPAPGNMWLLLGLLAFPIAPGIFWASAALSRKGSDA